MLRHLFLILGFLAIGNVGCSLWDSPDATPDDDDDENEVEVTLDEVPAAVKATILKAAGDARIEEIEREGTGDEAVYEAEFMGGDQEIEIKVSTTGELLGRVVEDEDDDEDDDDEDDDE